MKRLAVIVLISACSGAVAEDKTANHASGDSPTVAGAPGEAAGGASAKEGSVPDPGQEPGGGSAEHKPVEGPFSESRVQEIVRAHFDKMGACYSKGLERDTTLKGTINVSLTIDGEGSVVRATAPKSDKPKPKPKKKKKRHYWEKKPKEEDELITDTEVVTCVESEFMALRFPPTGRGLITLVYPVVFRTE